MDLLYTGRRMSAAEAQQWGLVCRVCPYGELMDTVRELGPRSRPRSATRFTGGERSGTSYL